MRTLVVLAAIASIFLTAMPAHAAPYGPVVGVTVQGSGVASGENDPAFVSTIAFSHVTVNVVDDVGQHTYFSACVETTGNSLCSASDPQGADYQADGFDSVTLDIAGGLPAGTSVTVFVYTVAVGGGLGDTTVGIGTTGTATATFS